MNRPEDSLRRLDILDAKDPRVQRALDALPTSIKPTPTLAYLAYQTFKRAEESSSPRDSAFWGRNIAALVAADAGPSACLQVCVESPAVAALRKLSHERFAPAGRFSVQDAATLIVIEVLTPIALSVANS